MMRRTFFMWLVVMLMAGPVVCRAQQDTIWGVTIGGGNGAGALFSMNLDGTNGNAAYNFMNFPDGSPTGSVIDYKGILYGFTSQGSNGSGGIYSYNIATAAYTALYSFDNTNGAGPSGRLTLDPANGLMYGVANYGGANSAGAIFSLDPVSGNYIDLYDFNYGSGGYNPVGPLTLYKGVFYGMAGGGANNGGVIFSFDPSSGTYTDLYDASDINAMSNDASFVVIGNLLYGVGSNGGTYNQGVLFSFNPATNAYTELVEFQDGGSTPLVYPMGIVTDGSTIYGVTQGSFFSSDRYGQLFSFNISSNAVTSLYSFSPGSGENPAGNVLLYKGNLLGTTVSGGSNGGGTAFSFNLVSGVYTDLQDFGYFGALGYSPEFQLLVVHTIGPTPQTIRFANLAKHYGDAPFDPGAVASSGLKVTYSSDNSTVAVVDGSGLIHITGTGTAHIGAFQDGNVVYDSLTVTDTLTVAPVPLLITAVDTFRYQYQANPVFRAGYTGLVNGDSAGSLVVQPVFATTALESSPQGTYPIAASGAVDSNYIITYQGGTLTVIGQEQFFVFDDTIMTYGDLPYDPGATTNSGLPVTYTSSNPAVALVDPDGTVKIVGAGTDTITALQAGNSVWAGGLQARVLTVNPAPLRIVVNDTTKIYRQVDTVFGAIFTGLVNGDGPGNIGAVFTCGGSGAEAIPGSYPIDVRLGAAATNNYAVTSYASGVLTVVPVGGEGKASLDAYFSSSTSLQVNVWAVAAGMVAVQVYDLAGRRLIGQQVSLGQGYNMMTLPAAGWAPGVYIVRVTVAGGKPLVKELVRYR